MDKDFSKKFSLFLSVLGSIFLVSVFIQWSLDKNGVTAYGWAAALASVVLALFIYINFVPKWMDFWRADCSEEDTSEDISINSGIYIRIFAALICFCVFVLIFVFVVRYSKGYTSGFSDSLEVWRETDANHYQDIAKEWYLSAGEWDRLVQLVFLPGYPLVVKAAAFLVGNFYYAAFIVSAVSFALSGCIMYRLLRLDYSHKDSLRAVKYLCIFPASFFFAGPLSESLFLLMCVSCIYCIRTNRWILGCLLGGYAAFTRSLGITLLVPAVLEYVKQTVNQDKHELKNTKNFINGLALTIIPSGFIAYCGINYAVSGDFFKFMEYQSKHWSQKVGWFFNTACYQTELVVSNWGQNFKIVAGLWLPNVIMVFASLVIILLSVRKIRASYAAWFIAYFVVAIGATWLLSAPRYLVAMMVLPIASASLTENKTADVIFTVCCGILNIIYLYTFAVRWYVW